MGSGASLTFCCKSLIFLDLSPGQAGLASCGSGPGSASGGFSTWACLAPSCPQNDFGPNSLRAISSAFSSRSPSWEGKSRGSGHSNLFTIVTKSCGVGSLNRGPQAPWGPSRPKRQEIQSQLHICLANAIQQEF